MTKLELMKTLLLHKSIFDVSTPQLLESVARKQVKYYTKPQLERLVNNLDQVVIGMRIS